MKEKEKIIPMGIYIGKVEKNGKGEDLATLHLVKPAFPNQKEQCSSEDIFSIPPELQN